MAFNLGFIRKILTVLTDLLVSGRNLGLWTKKNTIPGTDNKPNLGNR